MNFQQFESVLLLFTRNIASYIFRTWSLKLHKSCSNNWSIWCIITLYLWYVYIIQRL